MIMVKREWTPVDMNDAFFPVSEERVYWSDNYNNQHRIKDFVALVDERGNTLSVVTKGYNLVTNVEAYHWADYIIKGVFDKLKLEDFECFKLYMPASRGSMYMDLFVPYRFNQPFPDIDDAYVPFIRIENSYNKTVKLKYEVGFCRWICQNGAIIGRKSYQFSMNHSEWINGAKIDEIVKKARESIGSISDLWSEFQQKLRMLRKYYVPLDLWLPIFCKVYRVSNAKKITPQQEKRIARVKTSIKGYSEELGNNAYGLFNVMTDFASYPDDDNKHSFFTNSYQHKAGDWADEFLRKSAEENFEIYQYVGKDAIETAASFE